MHPSAKRLYEAAQKLGKVTKQGDVARWVGVSAQTLNNWEGRESGVSLRTRIALLDKYGVRPEWIETGEGEMLAKTYELIASSGHYDLAQPSILVRIPLLANAASMGVGNDLLSEDVIAGELTLTPEFVSDHLKPAKPEALRFLHAYGDSMSPTLNSGDVLLVNTAVKDASVDGIYVLEAHGRLFIKRVSTRMDGKHEISSDNPAKKTVDILNGDHLVEIKGRVIWVWNGRKV